MSYTKQTFTSGQILKASDLNTMLQGIVEKQDKLVSGTNIKTINGQSLLGSGNISIEGSDVTIDGATLGAKYAGFAYTNSETINACVGVPINAIRMYVHTAGVMSYGKCSSSSYEKLGELTLSDPSNTEVQTYTIPEVTLNEGERLWFGATSDKGLFYYGKDQSSNALGYFITGIKPSAPSGGATANENLSIDIGYVG